MKRLAAGEMFGSCVCVGVCVGVGGGVCLHAGSEECAVVVVVVVVVACWSRSLAPRGAGNESRPMMTPAPDQWRDGVQRAGPHPTFLPDACPTHTHTHRSSPVARRPSPVGLRPAPPPSSLIVLQSGAAPSASSGGDHPRRGELPRASDPVASHATPLSAAMEPIST